MADDDTQPDQTPADPTPADQTPADQTQADQPAVDETRVQETPPAAAEARDGDGRGRSVTSIPGWLAGALVVVLALAVGGAGFAIGRATADDEGSDLAPISEVVPGNRGSDEVPGFPGGGRFPGGIPLPNLPKCIRTMDPRDCFEHRGPDQDGGDREDRRRGDRDRGGDDGRDDDGQGGQDTPETGF